MRSTRDAVIGALLAIGGFALALFLALSKRN